MKAKIIAITALVLGFYITVNAGGGSRSSNAGSSSPSSNAIGTASKVGNPPIYFNSNGMGISKIIMGDAETGIIIGPEFSETGTYSTITAYTSFFDQNPKVYARFNIAKRMRAPEGKPKVEVFASYIF